ncbi:hypothetical protein EDC04DRAFT_3140934 [Pisolithus marmoratus]|nr:hypothetical protein EDC04DRAFT_3140934 [Pisolithus marmoratus]
MADFSPNRELLNPKFEGYKLQLISPGVARHGLPYKPTQATASGRSPLSLQEVQSRITHNHLVLSPAPGRVLYIDADRRVVVVDVDLTDITKTPSFNIVYELPVAISTAQAQSETVHREYPSAAFLEDDTAFVSDGRGSLYILNIPAHGPATLLSSFDLIDREVSSLPLPFRIHSVARVSDGTVIALLSSRHYDAEVLSLLTEQSTATSSTHPRNHLHHHLHSSEFDVWAARFTFPLNMMRIDSGTLNIVWRRRGEDVPMLAVYDASYSTYALIGSSTYREIGAPHTPAYEPSADEIAPIPRAGEDLDASNNTTPTKPYPYSWTQTPDVVTVAFPLPSSTPKSNITVLFSPTTLTLHVKGVPDVHEGVRIPRYSAKQLWDRIRPSTSFWTWDREGEHKFGILSVHLDKITEGQKWMHVFGAAGTCTITTTNSTGSKRDDDMDVPETLDPSELYLIREAFEKFTETLRTGEDASGLGLERGVPSLAQGEMDEEVDDSVGRLASFTWISEDGSTPPWWKKDNTSPFNLLSTPLPGTDTKLAGLVVKYSIDGLLYAAEETQGGGGMIAPGWKHTGTFSALAFVLASKRDTRFTHHTQNAIFAFENGSVDRGGNVYIYRRSSPNQLCAKQSVLKVGDGNAGSLLGVGAFKNDNKSDSMTILCLCENQLIVLYDVF